MFRYFPDFTKTRAKRTTLITTMFIYSVQCLQASSNFTQIILFLFDYINLEYLKLSVSTKFGCGGGEDLLGNQLTV
jgi:hypothetical protein